MRKGIRPLDQPDNEGDEQLQSRMGIKKKLNFISEDFNLSRFSESRSEHSKVSSLFPQLNDPTLELKELEFSKIDDGLEKYYPEGPTARVSPGRQGQFRQELESVSQQLEQKEAEVKTLKKKYEQSQRDLERARRETSAKDELIQRQRDEIEELRGKRSTITESRDSGSNRSSLMEESINNFCPELLSPEETVQLLSSLLQKVTKSSKMVKSLTSNTRTRQILSKITRTDNL